MCQSFHRFQMFSQTHSTTQPAPKGMHVENTQRYGGIENTKSITTENFKTALSVPRCNLDNGKILGAYKQGDHK